MVHNHVVSMNEPNRVTLAHKARGVLARALGRDPSEFRSMSGIGKVSLLHHEVAVDLAVAVHVACARARSFVLREFLFERDIRALLGAPKGALVPDATAVIAHVSGSDMAVAFEVDLASENPSYIARTKIEPYAALQAAGHSIRGCRDWMVCCTVPSERRLNRLALAAWETAVPEGLWYFAVADSLDARNVLTAVWKTPRVVQERALLVAESPLHEQLVQGVPTDRTDQVSPGRYRTGGVSSRKYKKTEPVGPGVSYGEIHDEMV